MKTREAAMARLGALPIVGDTLRAGKRAARVFSVSPSSQIVCIQHIPRGRHAHLEILRWSRRGRWEIVMREDQVEAANRLGATIRECGHCEATFSARVQKDDDDPRSAVMIWWDSERSDRPPSPSSWQSSWVYCYCSLACELAARAAAAKRAADG